MTLEVGEKIRQLRLKREVTQRELADGIGIAVTYLSKIENRRVKPYLSEEKLKKIAEKLNLTEDEENELFDLAKKISPSTKEQIARPSINQFLRTIAPELSDQRIRKIIREYKK